MRRSVCLIVMACVALSSASTINAGGKCPPSRCCHGRWVAVAPAGAAAAGQPVANPGGGGLADPINAGTGPAAAAGGGGLADPINPDAAAAATSTPAWAEEIWHELAVYQNNRVKPKAGVGILDLRKETVLSGAALTEITDTKAARQQIEDSWK